MQLDKKKVIAQMQFFVFSDHTRVGKSDHGVVMQEKTKLIENRATAREANQDSVVLRYIQFMLGQQQYARLREVDAREALQESDNSMVGEWWFDTEGKKYVCFYLWLAQFENREINISEMAYHLGKSREFVSRTLTAARRLNLLDKENHLSDAIGKSIKKRVLSFLNSRSSHAFVRTAMVKMIMETAVVMESENAQEIKDLRQKSVDEGTLANFYGIDDMFEETLFLDRFKNAAE
tara:strand:+ start:1110 stop:1814 length:705 start_codon:yes stop_codon:yes gene_type:complete